MFEVLQQPSTRMSLNDLSRMIFDFDLELVMMEASGAELGCTTLGFLYIWYLIFCHRWEFRCFRWQLSLSFNALEPLALVCNISFRLDDLYRNTRYMMDIYVKFWCLSLTLVIFYCGIISFTLSSEGFRCM